MVMWKPVQTAEDALELVAALLEGGRAERSIGRACCLALCQAGVAEPLLKMVTGDPQQPISLRVSAQHLACRQHVCQRAHLPHLAMARGCL